MSTSDEKVWQTTAIQNLVRYMPSGVYFAREFRDRGDENQRALRTKSTCATKTTSAHRCGDDVMRSDGRSQFLPRNCRSPVSTSAEAVFLKSKRAFRMWMTRHFSI